MEFIELQASLLAVLMFLDGFVDPQMCICSVIVERRPRKGQAVGREDCASPFSMPICYVHRHLADL